MVSDTVVAIIPEDVLSDVLTHIHRAGLGNNARVLRPRRAPIREQLRRAGVPVEQAPDRIDAASCVLTVMAAARCHTAADLMQHQGASATWIVARAGSWSLVDDHVVVETAPASMPASPAVHPAIPRDDERAPDATGPI